MPKHATPDQKEEQPSFVFFQATPTDMMNHPPLAVSLQLGDQLLRLAVGVEATIIKEFGIC